MLVVKGQHCVLIKSSVYNNGSFVIVSENIIVDVTMATFSRRVYLYNADMFKYCKHETHLRAACVCDKVLLMCYNVTNCFSVTMSLIALVQDQ